MGLFRKSSKKSAPEATPVEPPKPPVKKDLRAQAVDAYKLAKKQHFVNQAQTEYMESIALSLIRIGDLLEREVNKGNWPGPR